MTNQFTEIFEEELKNIDTQARVLPTDSCDIKRQKRLTEIYNNLRNNNLSDLCETLPSYSSVIAEELSKNITPTQLRRFYTYVKSIDRKNLHQKDEDNIIDKAKLKFLLPKLAGSVEKKSQDGVKALHRVFAECLHGNRINQVKDFRLFIEFFEAILDYHSTFKPQKQD